QGEIGDIKENQLYQWACRVGTWKRAYNERASNWQPGTTITNVANKTTWDNIPSYPGTDAIFTDLTALSYTNVFADGDRTWDRQLYVFVENGLKVTRILDSTLGSSNNFIDLAIYLIKESQRLPDDLIDTTSMTAAANFLNTNNFLCNGVVSQSQNLEDFLTQTGNQFLLRLSEKDGKKCFKPRLPVNADHTINSTNAITPVFGFNEDHILEGSFEIQYIPITERQDAKAIVMWKQQNDNDLAIIRSSEVQQSGVSNPVIIQYDLSQWCCSESHAVKYGAYQIAKRKYITHSLRISVRPSTFNSTLSLGDIVRVRLRRETNAGTVDHHDYLYEVERIEKSTTGVVKLDLVHFPVDSSKRSIIARAVAAATPVGTVISSSRTDITCHTNTGTGNIPDDGVTWPSLGGTGFTLGTFTEDFPFEEDLGNATDPLESDFVTGITDDRTDSSPLKVGDTLTATGGACANGRICWYRRNKIGSHTPSPTWGVKTLISCSASSSGTGSMQLTTADLDHWIISESSCPDPASDDGFGTPTPIGEVGPIEPDFSSFTWVRWVGTKTKHIAAGKYYSGTNNNIPQFSDVEASTETTHLYSTWVEFDNYVTLAGGIGCGGGLGAGQVLVQAGVEVTGGSVYGKNNDGPGGIVWPNLDVPWRANVRATDLGSPGGLRTIGGLTADGVGLNSGCAYGVEPKLYVGGSTWGSYAAMEGQWEFTNAANPQPGTNETPELTWKGRDSGDDGFDPNYHQDNGF
ncbi:MAG: hypothetical protein CMC15_16805, partial [Flavobacteriaceae bacterium]|nr:hypothetical protein [Flavobacteriaceae bacterium]